MIFEETRMTKRAATKSHTAALLRPRDSSYTQLTMHSGVVKDANTQGTRTGRSPAKRITSKPYRDGRLAASRQLAATSPAVPNVAQSISVDLSLIVQEEENGVLKTPMTKIRFFPDGGWKQVPRTEAGMFVFFNNEPKPHHKYFVITSIIPSKTACYADLM